MDYGLTLYQLGLSGRTGVSHLGLWFKQGLQRTFGGVGGDILPWNQRVCFFVVGSGSVN